MDRGFVVWFTGLSGAGKSTLAPRLGAILRERGLKVEVLDGDVVRTNLSKGLGFSKEDRDTNIRRIGFVSGMLARNGVAAIAAAISPYREIRDEIRRDVGDFVEVYVRCPIEVLAERDRKGLYAKALRGEIPNFTGVSDPYEEPVDPEVVLDTDKESEDESLAKLVSRLEELGYIRTLVVSESAPGSKKSPAKATAGSPPHGGQLVNLLVGGSEAEALRERVPSMPVVALNARTVSDVELLANGGYSPLEGFMTSADYRCVVAEMRLASGLPWSMPITLAVSKEEAAPLKEGQEVALADPSGEVLAVLELAEKFGYDKRLEAREVYRTEEEAHPGVAALYAQGDVLLGGRLRALALPGHDDFPQYRLTPAQTRAAFAERGWRTVVGFQTRNPVHRAHEYIQKCALETVEGLLLHPLVGQTKGDDIPADVRMRCYEVLLEGYYPRDRTLLSVNPAAMRYAGPREAIFHALVRKNYGCTHFIVGRDHAGVGKYYGPYDAQHIFSEFGPGELGIAPMFFDNTFFCKRCAGMASAKTCPHQDDDRVVLSGTQVREMLKGGLAPPTEFTRPEVAEVLIEAMQERATPHYAV